MISSGTLATYFVFIPTQLMHLQTADFIGYSNSISPPIHHTVRPAHTMILLCAVVYHPRLDMVVFVTLLVIYTLYTSAGMHILSRSIGRASE